MLETATLDVLARAAEIGLPEAVTVPISAYDPFFRPAIKKRVLRAVAAAEARTTRKMGDHVLRLAFLSVHPSAPPIANADDDRAISAAFEKLAAPYLPPREAPEAERAGGAYRVIAKEREAVRDYVAPPRPKRKFWPVTTSVLASIVVGALGVSGAMAAPYIFPTPYEKFTHSPFGTALADPLTTFVATSSSLEDRSDARSKLESKPVEKQIGKDNVQSLERVLVALRTAPASHAESTDDALVPLTTAINDLDRRLVDAHVPALLHSYASGYADRRSFWVTSYFVEERADVRIGGHDAASTKQEDRPFRIAWGRRIDELNLLDTTIYKGALEDWTILSLDHIDDELVQVLLAPLALGQPMGPEEYVPTDTSAGADFARKASNLVSAELLSAAHITREDAAALHHAIGERNDLMITLARLGYSITPSTRIWLTPGMRSSLERTKTRRGGGYEAKLAGDILRIDERMKVYAKPLHPITSALALLEEEQFLGRLAEERRLAAIPRPLPAPTPATPTVTAIDDDGETYAPVLKPNPSGPVYFGGSARIQAVASGELMTLARDRKTPRLALYLLLRRGLDRSLASFASDLVIDALFKKLGVAAKDTLIGEAFAQAAMRAMEMPSERIRENAARAYEEAFGHPVPSMTRTKLP